MATKSDEFFYSQSKTGSSASNFPQKSGRHENLIWSQILMQGKYCFPKIVTLFYYYFWPCYDIGCLWLLCHEKPINLCEFLTNQVAIRWCGHDVVTKQFSMQFFFPPQISEGITTLAFCFIGIPTLFSFAHWFINHIWFIFMLSDWVSQ